MTTTLICITNDIVRYYLKLAKLQKELHYDTMILISKSIRETIKI